MTANFRYQATNRKNGEVIITSEHLPEVLKLIRKIIKTPHGNKLRTQLLEHGEVILVGKHRKPKTEAQRMATYDVSIIIDRW